MCNSYPLYNFCSYESNITSEAPKIKFYAYIKFTSCSIHGLLVGSSVSCDTCRESDETKGKITTRKILAMKEITIGKFMSDFYLPALENFVYHIHNVKILSKHFYGDKGELILCASLVVY